MEELVKLIVEYDGALNHVSTCNNFVKEIAMDKWNVACKKLIDELEAHYYVEIGTMETNDDRYELHDAMKILCSYLQDLELQCQARAEPWFFYTLKDDDKLKIFFVENWRVVPITWKFIVTV